MRNVVMAVLQVQKTREDMKAPGKEGREPASGVASSQLAGPLARVYLDCYTALLSLQEREHCLLQ